MFRSFEGATADEAWVRVAAAFRHEHLTLAQPSRSGPTLEMLHAGISIADPKQRWISSRRPPINIPFALAELIWIMRGRNDSSFVNFFNTALPSFAGKGPTYHGAYGERLRRHFGFDQIERAYLALRNNLESRQIVLQIWDSITDMPLSDGKPVDTDVPCNISAMLKVRDNKLEWCQVMRSNDVFRGLPYNIVQFTSIQEILAGWLGLEIGSYNHLSDSLHIYCADYSDVCSAKPLNCELNNDSLGLSKQASDTVFQKLEIHVNEIRNSDVGEDKLVGAVHDSQMPPAYKNILCILAAEGLRRRSCLRRIAEVIDECTNLTYRHLFQEWLTRCSSSTSARAAGKSTSVSEITFDL